jgi:hypothetical protein
MTFGKIRNLISVSFYQCLNMLFRVTYVGVGTYLVNHYCYTSVFLSNLYISINILWTICTCRVDHFLKMKFIIETYLYRTRVMFEVVQYYLCSTHATKMMRVLLRETKKGRSTHNVVSNTSPLSEVRTHNLSDDSR